MLPAGERTALAREAKRSVGGEPKCCGEVGVNSSTNGERNALVQETQNVLLGGQILFWRGVTWSQSLC